MTTEPSPDVTRAAGRRRQQPRANVVVTIGGADRQLSSRFEGAGEEPQLGVAGERVEVPVGVEQVEVGSDGHRSDEAVGERSSRVAGSTDCR